MTTLSVFLFNLLIEVHTFNSVSDAELVAEEMSYAGYSTCVSNS